jgi:putative nucleotidyltransferase with HDIG domain
MTDNSIFNPESDASIIREDVLQRMVSAIGELPASPAIITAVMSMTANLDSNVTEVSRLLATDSTLTAKVLKLANSSYYGRPKAVSSVREAILILGFYAVRTLVIASSARSLFSGDEPDGPVEKLWRHSLATAVAARQIAGHLRHPQRDEVFIAGLLHDIGKLVMLESLGFRYRDMILQVEHVQGSFIEEERKYLGFTHVDVARLLTARWGLPRVFVTAVAEHHDLRGYRPDSPMPMSYIVHLANHLSKQLRVGFNDAREMDLGRLESTQAMRLEDEELEELISSVREYYETEIRILDEQ